MASLLNTLCEPCYSSFPSPLKINGKDCLRLIPFSVQTLTYSIFFFHNIHLNLSDFAYLITKNKKGRGFVQSEQQTYVPSLIKFSQDWKRCLAFFLVLESTCGMLHACARKEAQPRLSERLFGDKKKKYLLILCFEKLRSKND